MSEHLPPSIVDEFAEWPEFRMGVNRVRVVLADGRAFDDVMVAGNRVVKVLGSHDIPFEASEVVVVTDLSKPHCRSATERAHLPLSVLDGPRARV